jgi:type 1 fimbriae regulatory protein FimE
LRANEITKLQWAAIVLEGKRTTITVNRSKGGVSTVHPLRGPEIRAPRVAGPARRPIALCLHLAPWRALERAQRTSNRLIVQEAGEAADIPFPVHPHILRHACGYKLASDGQDTRAIQDYLGHRSINSTVRYMALAPNRFEAFWDD